MSKAANSSKTNSLIAGILMGLTFALKQGINVIRILELQWHLPTLMFME